jgi:hypothetical protein
MVALTKPADDVKPCRILPVIARAAEATERHLEAGGLYRDHALARLEARLIRKASASYRRADHRHGDGWAALAEAASLAALSIACRRDGDEHGSCRAGDEVEMAVAQARSIFRRSARGYLSPVVLSALGDEIIPWETDCDF